jgi:methyltransferase (TIGR00027 family)
VSVLSLPSVEDRLAEAIERGIGQYVILGAGLDTFAYRSPMAGQVAVYEVDQPETSAWKLELLKAANIPVSAGVRLVRADLSAGSVVDRLVEAGFDRRRRAFVSWTGVTMYLDRGATASTLGAIGGLAAGSETVFDHVLPREQRDAAGTEYASFAESVGASNGEPWITSLAIDELETILAEAGLEAIAQPLLEDWVDPVLWQRTDSIRPYRLWAMAHSRVSGR